MNLANLISDPVAAQIAQTILHSIWEAAVVALFLAFLLKAIPTKRSGLRYWICCGALVAVTVLAITTFAILRARDVGNPAIGDVPANMKSMAAGSAPLATHAPAEHLVLPSVAMPGRAWIPFRVIVVAWALGVAFYASWHVAGWMWLWRIRHVEPASAQWEAILRRLSERLRLRRSVTVIESARVITPWVVGAFKPVILVPIGLAANLSPGYVEVILAHELAHVRRHDYLVNLIQSAVETLMFYHPAVWWISRQIRQERECCCDRMAAEIHGDPAAYVEALLALERSRDRRTALALAASGGDLVHRVRRVLNLPAPRSVQRIRSIAVAALAMICLSGAFSISRFVRAEAPPTSAASAPGAQGAVEKSIQESPEKANRVRCARNEKEIGLALINYGNDHRGHLPNTLGELLKTEKIPIDVFVCPSSHTEIPKDIRRAGVSTQAKWVDEHSDYIYLGRGKTTAVGQEKIILYEKARDHDFAGINILFGDTHVEWWSAADAVQKLRRQNLPVPEGLARQATQPAKRGLQKTAPTKPLATAPAAKIDRDIRTCMGNLRGIAQLILWYANDHKGQMPHDLGQTLPFLGKSLSGSSIYICPDEVAHRPVPEKPTPQWVNQNTSYIYLGGAQPQLNNIKGNIAYIVIAYERRARGHNGLVPTLFLDGHVELLTPEQLKPLLEQSEKILGTKKAG